MRVLCGEGFIIHKAWYRPSLIQTGTFDGGFLQDWKSLVGEIL